ncbi:MAG TPA: VWA domain-containing protein [Candidatus Hydrogenedentes bacterium]|nr:VWA domain-containing protein [Candidatus Hydrogenedentota bacterium]
MYDALLDAVRRFGLVSAGAEDDSYIVLFSNGRDTSSTAVAAQVIAEAVARRVRIITVGFGETVDTAALRYLASSTGGRYIPAESIEDLQPAFERIVEDLEGQYIVRWASLRRDNQRIRPAFTIAFGGASATYTAAEPFRATDHVGDPLAGRLTLVQSDAPSRTTVMLRANYVPRGIGAIRCWVKSNHEFTTSLVGPADDGLMADWNLTQETAEDGWWITATSSSATLPFAAFGPMLRFDFKQAVTRPSFNSK